MKTLVILSGGMDSTTALFLEKTAGNDIVALNFQYGSKHNVMEDMATKNICEFAGVHLHQIDLPFMNDFKSDLLKSGGAIPEGHYADPSMKKTVVPFRNGIMLSIAAGFAESKGAEKVIIGNHAGDHAIYPDCRANFIQSMGSAMYCGTYAEIKLKAPFLYKTKADIAKIGSEIGVPFELTYSCYNGRPKHCGKCGTCFERKEAFQLAGIEDPTSYE